MLLVLRTGMADMADVLVEVKGTHGDELWQLHSGCRV